MEAPLEVDTVFNEAEFWPDLEILEVFLIGLGFVVFSFRFVFRRNFFLSLGLEF